MKKIYFLLTFYLMFAFLNKALGQCSIKSTISDDKKFKTNLIEFESLYKNEDFENGLFVIKMSLGVKISETKPTILYYYLQIAVINSASKKEIIPRKLIINSFKPFEASFKAPANFSNGTTIQSCVYDLTEDDFKYFKDVPISHMAVIDPVEGSNIDFYVNSRIITNQATCIDKLVKAN